MLVGVTVFVGVLVGVGVNVGVDVGVVDGQGYMSSQITQESNDVAEIYE